MANNETVEQVCEEMKEVTGTSRFIDSHYCNHCGDQIDGEGSALDVYSDRILEAHKREMDERDKYRNRKVFRLTQALAKCRREKDAENARLRTLVKELADALEKSERNGSYCGEYQRNYIHKKRCALVSRAREMIEGAK